MNFTGKVLSSFRLIEKLGQGSMGLVYKAVHEQTSSPGAVKFIDLTSSHLNGGGALTMAQRFMDEARAMSSVNSPYIVKILAIGQDEQVGDYIVLEYLPGLTLEQTLAQEKQLTLSSFRNNLANPLLKGLFTMHSRGILHRDIKPGNLIADESGIYKISDFGLAVFKERSARTKTGIVIGSPGYMAPELFSTPVSVAGQPDKSAIYFGSDLYSAGVVLTEALTGEHPFRTPNLADTIRKQLSYIPTGESICSLGRKNGISVSSVLAEVLARSLSPEPDNRWESCADFLNALEASLDQEIVDKGSFAKVTRSFPSSGIKGSKGSVIGGIKDAKSSSSGKRAPKVKAPDNKVRTSGNRGLGRKLVPLFLMLILLVPMLWFYSSSGIMSSSNIQSSTGVNDPVLIKMMQDFSSVSKRLTKEGANPSRASIEEFFDTGVELYSLVSEHNGLSPTEKRHFWKESTSGLNGPAQLLGMYISNFEAGGDNSCNAGDNALKAYRDSFSSWFSKQAELSASGLVPLKGFLAAYLEVDSWFVEKLLLSQSTAFSDMDYYRNCLNLIGGTNKFVNSVLPAVQRQNTGIEQRESVEGPPYWDEAVKYRIKLFLWRAFVFSFRVPVEPYSPFIKDDFKGISEDEFVASVDSGHSIGRSVEYLLDKGSINQADRIELKKVCCELLGIFKNDERYSKAIASSDLLITSTEDAPDCDFASVSRENYFNYLDESRRFLVSTEQTICGFWENAGAISGAITGALQSIDPKSIQLAKGASVVIRRGIWSAYTLLVMENTMLLAGTNLRQSPIRMLLFMSDFLSFFAARVPMDILLKKVWLGPGLDESSFSEMFEVVASIPLKGCKPELLWPLQGENYSSDLLSYHSEYSQSILETFDHCKNYFTSQRFDFRYLMKLLLVGWDEVLYPMVDRNSILSLLITSERLLLKTDGISAEEHLSESLEFSSNLLDLLKGQVRAEKMESASTPFLKLLLEVSERRWRNLRRSGNLDKLLSEALWAQNTFAYAVNIAPADCLSRQSEIHLFSVATAQIGHVYLERKQTDLFDKVLPLLKEAKQMEENVSSVRFNLIVGVVEGRKLW